MNNKIFDRWSLLHLIFSFFLTISFLRLEIELMLILITIVLYEVLEHSFIGNMVFGWFKAKRTESSTNTLMDIIIGIFGLILGVIYLM